MVEENKISEFYIGEQFNIISQIANKIGDYTEFNNRYAEMIVKKANLNEWDKFLVNFYKRVLEDATQIYLKLINNKIELKVRLNNESNNLNKIRERLLLNDLKLEELHSIKNNISEIIDRIINQIELNKLTAWEKWKERIIGLIIGIIGSIVIYKLGFS